MGRKKPSDDILAWIYHKARSNSTWTCVIRNIANLQMRLLFPALKDKEKAFKSKDGSTPLHIAASMGQKEILTLLFEGGADPSIRNKAGHLAVKCARSEEIQDMLLRYAEKHEKLTKDAEVQERRKCPLEHRLQQRIIGQEHAISVVTSAIRRKEFGWQREDCPLVFLFLGPSGVGKTELAKHIAHYFHPGNPEAFVRLDMSEYQRRFDSIKLIGSPPGYLGHDKGGHLTNQLLRCPSAVVLLDEVDKAHANVLTTLLQLFDEGRITDGRGSTIDCKDAVFVMTANLATEEISSFSRLWRSRDHRMLTDGDLTTPLRDEERVTFPRQFTDAVLGPILKNHFKRFEFLGRIDEVVCFAPFAKSSLLKLISMELGFWARKALKHRILLLWDDEVEATLAEGYNPHFGVRSLRHQVDRGVINRLAIAHEQGLLKDGCIVQLLTQPPNIKIRVSNPPDCCSYLDVDDSLFM